MKKKVISFNLGTMCEIMELQKERNIDTFENAMEEYAKLHPNDIQDLGTLAEDGSMTRSEITVEGVETKEVNFADELEKLIDNK